MVNVIIQSSRGIVVNSVVIRILTEITSGGMYLMTSIGKEYAMNFQYAVQELSNHSYRIVKQILFRGIWSDISCQFLQGISVYNSYEEAASVAKGMK